MSSSDPTGAEKFRNAIFQAQLKISRAEHHLQEIQSILRSLPEGGYCTVTQEFDPETGLYHFGVRTEKLPANLPLSVGDCFNNLTSALDYVATGIMRATKAKTGRTTFPSHETRQQLRRSFLKPRPNKESTPNRKIREACPQFFLVIIRKLKPYKGGGHLIQEVRQASNMDKHNLIIPTLHAVSLRDVLIVDEGRNIRMRQDVELGPNGQVRFGSMDGNPVVQDYGRASLEMRFPDSNDVFPGLPVVPTILQCIKGVREAIRICETDLSPRTLSEE